MAICSELPVAPLKDSLVFQAPLLQNVYTWGEPGIFSYICMHIQKRPEQKCNNSHVVQLYVQHLAYDSFRSLAVYVAPLSMVAYCGN